MSLLEEAYEPPLPTPSGPPGPPIATFQLQRDVAGVDTELVIQAFDDRILVIVTQNGKIGCLVRPLHLLTYLTVDASDSPTRSPIKPTTSCA